MQMTLQTTLQTLEAFLSKAPTNAPDLLSRWSRDMETQINVVPGKVRNENGGWSDELGNDWFPIRIPKQANSDPFYHDRPQSFSFAEKAEAIGCTGWDWKNGLSRWVAFDFDSITGHAAGVGLTAEKLQQVREAACGIPWVEVRRSTGGNGLHLYVTLAEPVPTENHNEHAALGRAILGLMSQEAGFNFGATVDCAGGNIWIWSRRATEENRGLSLIKAGEPLSSAPSNWRSHLDVVTRRRAKVRVVVEGEDEFEQLTSARRATPLDANHRRLIDYLTESGFSTFWVQDYYLLQTHTVALKKAHEDLGLIGLFETTSQGDDPGEPNCFLFAAPNGGWNVYRFSPGTVEADTWTQNGRDWTYCDFNMAPSLPTLVRVFEGAEGSKVGTYKFSKLSQVVEVLKNLGIANPDVPSEWLDRDAQVSLRKDEQLIVTVDQQPMSIDDALKCGAVEVSASGRVVGKLPVENLPKTKAWHSEGKKWVAVFQITLPPRQSVLRSCDNTIRSLVGPDGENTAGWVIKTNSENWIRHPKDDAKSVLLSQGYSRTEVDLAFGEAVSDSWRLVNLPFQPEYPGDRQWNLNSPQFRFRPADTDHPRHPHWDSVLEHCGFGLNEDLAGNEWANENGIKTGGEYLRLWTSCMLREPFEPLPYLFLFGDQNCGKSIFHEALSLLMTRGVVPADRALTSKGDFNGELANAVLCYVEETDLSEAGAAVYNKVKDWVTSPVLSIHPKRRQVYTQANTTKWVQCANSRSACPVFDGDTRITMIHVPTLQTEIPKPTLLKYLSEEAPYFMRTLLDLHVPISVGRLRIPVIETDEKRQAQDSNLSELDVFLRENTCYVSGEKVLYKDLYDKFIESLSPYARSQWNRKKFSAGLPKQHPIGVGSANKRYVGNVSFEDKESIGTPLVCKGGKLVPNSLAL